jgi:dihydropteroate synthase
MPHRATRLASPWPEAKDGLPLVMGIVNVTPDSFSDGGFFAQAERAITHGRELAEQGASILDIGGESTRPGANVISATVEIARVLPVVSALAERGDMPPISIDTYKSETAAAALRAGARIVNDVWGLMADPKMADVVAENEAGLCIMHNRETKDEAIDIVSDIEDFFGRSLEKARKSGIPDERIALDPGIGFGKTFEQNIAALRSLPRLKRFGRALLVGLSRKSMLGLLTDRPVNQRLAGSLAGGLAVWLAGADILRVHDVIETMDALRVFAALKQGSSE